MPTETPKTIDITPTWEEALGVYARILPSLDATGQATARKEMMRAGRLLDRLIAEQRTKR